MTQDIKTNPKYVAHSLAMPVSAMIGLAFAIPAGMMISDKIGDEVVLPDQTGSAMEVSIMAEHQADFTKLEQMKGEIELLESQTVLTNGSAELTEMKSDFNRLAVSAYGDLYLDGSTQENGAGLSETHFQELHNAFAEKIINPKTIGFVDNIDAGMLDETLAQTDLKTGSDVERFQTVKALTQALSEHQAATADNNDKAGFASFMGGVLTFILFLVGGATVNEKYKWEPRRIPSNRPKTPYGKH